MRSLIITTCLLAALLAAAAPDTRTTRRGLKASVHASPTAADTTACGMAETDSLVAHGYDKPLRSRSESLFVSNTGGTTITTVALDITYMAMDSTMLHRRTITLPCSIPAGETRRLSFRAWDTQQAYYHHTTRIKPRSPKAIPYRVAIKVNGTY